MKSQYSLMRNQRWRDRVGALPTKLWANGVRCTRRAVNLKEMRWRKRAGKRRTSSKTDRLAFSYVRVGYWIFRSAKQQALVVQNFVYDFQLLMLQETREKEETTIKCPGCDCYTVVGHLYTTWNAALSVKWQWLQHWRHWDTGYNNTCRKPVMDAL